MSEDAAASQEDPRRREADAAGKDAGAPGAQSFAALLGAAAGVTGALSLGLFAVFAWLDLGGAPYWAVAVAVVGGVVMRRMLLAAPTAGQTVLFSAAAIGGALAGLWVADLFFS